MLDPKSQNDLKDAIGECIGADASVLDALRSEIRPLKSLVRRIQPRTTTSISLVGTDGGNNQLQFDPFLIQMIRVVDSSDNQYCLEVVSPTTPVRQLVSRHLDDAGVPLTAFGEMMSYLGIKLLPDLSHMIRSNDGGRPVSPSWVQVYSRNYTRRHPPFQNAAVNKYQLVQSFLIRMESTSGPTIRGARVYVMCPRLRISLSYLRREKARAHSTNPLSLAASSST
jgi:hypothetical protein